MKPVPRGKLVSFISWMTPAHPVCGYIHLYVHCSCESVCTHTTQTPQPTHQPVHSVGTNSNRLQRDWQAERWLRAAWPGRAVIRMQWQWFHHNHGSEEMQSLSKDDIWTDDTRWMSLVWNLNTQNTLGLSWRHRGLATYEDDWLKWETIWNTTWSVLTRLNRSSRMYCFTGSFQALVKVFSRLLL